jgi:hypothetical protein
VTLQLAAEPSPPSGAGQPQAPSRLARPATRSKSHPAATSLGHPGGAPAATPTPVRRRPVQRDPAPASSSGPPVRTAQPAQPAPPRPTPTPPTSGPTHEKDDDTLVDAVLGMLAVPDVADQVARRIAPRVIRAGLLDDPTAAEDVARTVAPSVLRLGGAGMRKNRERLGALRDRHF